MMQSCWHEQTVQQQSCQKKIPRSLKRVVWLTVSKAEKGEKTEEMGVRGKNIIGDLKKNSTVFGTLMWTDAALEDFRQIVVDKVGFECSGVRPFQDFGWKKERSSEMKWKFDPSQDQGRIFFLVSRSVSSKFKWVSQNQNRGGSPVSWGERWLRCNHWKIIEKNTNINVNKESKMYKLRYIFSAELATNTLFFYLQVNSFMLLFFSFLSCFSL